MKVFPYLARGDHLPEPRVDARGRRDKNRPNAQLAGHIADQRFEQIRQETVGQSLPEQQKSKYRQASKNGVFEARVKTRRQRPARTFGGGQRNG